MSGEAITQVITDSSGYSTYHTYGFCIKKSVEICVIRVFCVPAHYPFSLYSFGDIPVIRLKNFPKNDWLAKFNSSLIC